VDDGINATRVKFNRFWFDRDNCGTGVDTIRMYRAEYDDKNRTLKQRPLHDWASHGADALRCGVMGAQENRMAIAQVEPETEWVV
jgi:phage terminase large subunit